MNEGLKNPNRIMALPKDVYVVPRTLENEMLTRGWERKKFRNERGEEFLEIPHNRYAADQMLAVSILAGRPGQQPIIPCSTIAAHKTKHSWRYFSHRTLVEDMAEMTMAEAIACELFLLYVFADYDHSSAHRNNVQIKEVLDKKLMRAAFFDFHKVAHFWEDRESNRIRIHEFNETIRYTNLKSAMKVEPGEVRAELLKKLTVFGNLLKGEQGISYITEILSYIPENPEVTGGNRVPSEVIPRHVQRFRDALLERVHASQVLFSK